jgi:hypothetical protein
LTSPKVGPCIATMELDLVYIDISTITLSHSVDSTHDAFEVRGHIVFAVYFVNFPRSFLTLTIAVIMCAFGCVYFVFLHVCLRS